MFNKGVIQMKSQQNNLIWAQHSSFHPLYCQIILVLVNLTQSTTIFGWIYYYNLKAFLWQ